MKQFPFRKGDILKNGWAGEKNPQQYTMYLKAGAIRQGRYSMKTFDAMAYDGTVVHHCQRDHRLEVVGHLDEYDAFLTALKRLRSMEQEGK